MCRIIKSVLCVILALVPLVPCVRAAAPTRERAVGRQPKLLYSWWKKGHPFAQAVGFVSPSAAVILRHAQPEVVGIVHGLALGRIVQIVEGTVGQVLGGPVGHAHAMDYPAFNELFAVEHPTPLMPPSGWVVNDLTASYAASEVGPALAVTVQSSKGVSGVCLWNLATHNVIGVLKSPRASSLGMTFSPGGHHLAVAYAPDRGKDYIKIWDVSAAKSVLILSAPTGKSHWNPLAVAYLGPRRVAVAADDGRRVRLYLADLTRNGRLKAAPRSSVQEQQNLFYAHQLRTLLYLPAQNRIVFAMMGIVRPSIYVCNAKTGQLLRRVMLPWKSQMSSIVAIANVPQRRRIIAAVTNFIVRGMPGYFVEIDVATGQVLWRSPGISGGCMSVVISPNGRTAMTGGMLGAQLWRLPPDEGK